MIKATLLLALLVIGCNAFSQKIDSVFLSSTVTLLSSMKTPEPKYDTVDVIALVSDTANDFGGEIVYYGEIGKGYIGYSIIAIKCKAVRENNTWTGGLTQGNITFEVNAIHDNWQIKEYLLPKKYIVWQSIIIKN